MYINQMLLKLIKVIYQYLQILESLADVSMHLRNNANKMYIYI